MCFEPWWCEARLTALGRLFAESQIESLNKTQPAYKWWQRRDAKLLNLFSELVGPDVEDPPSTALQLAAVLDGLRTERQSDSAAFTSAYTGDQGS
jgi:hypothetical protein